MIQLLALLAFADSGYAQAESLLAKHQLPEARVAAEQLVKDHPDDERAHLLLGRVMFEWPVTGRYDALTQFRAAERLAPDDPEPPYREAMVGFFLHSEDGNDLATSSLIKVFAIDPDYRDAWTRFARVYQSPGVWRNTEAALARHPRSATALRRRADLELELNEPGKADSLAAELLTLAPNDEEALLDRAEAGFISSPARDAAGYAWYDSAVAHAAQDTANAMWEAIWMIATPEEAARYDSTAMEARPTFLRAFWAKRDPNLVTPQNERIAEHFRRLAYARVHFRLLHPQNSFFYSEVSRQLSAQYERDFVAGMVSQNCAGGEDALPGGEGFLPEASPDAWLASHGLGPDFESVDSTVTGDLMARAGIDSRGLVYVRYGPPDAELDGSPDPNRACQISRSFIAAPEMLVEGWSYNGPHGPLTIAFLRHTAGDSGMPGGDYVFMPITRHQVQSARYLMHTDRTSLPAPLEAHVWSASFRDTLAARTRIYFRTRPDTAAARLWSERGDLVASTSGAGLISLAAPPGLYQMGIDVDSAGRLGRARRALNVASYPPTRLTLSSLVLSLGSDQGDRESALRGVPADLVYEVGRPVTAYTEIYGLGADGAGASRYQVEYTFEHTRGFLGALIQGRSPITFSFTRESPAEPMKIERLTIEPGRLPAGSYRVTLTVTDLATQQRTRSVAIDVDVR